MKFTDAKVEKINDVLHDMKKANPYHSKREIGIGIQIFNGVGKTIVAIDNTGFANVEDLGRVIEELQMLKEAIENETGLEL